MLGLGHRHDDHPRPVREALPARPRHPRRRPGPRGRRPDGREPRPRHPADLRHRRRHGRRRGDDVPLKIGQTRYNSGFLLGIKAFTAAVLGGIGNLRGALLGGFVLGRGRELRPGDLRPSGRTSWRSPCWSSSCCSDPPACSVSPSERHAHERRLDTSSTASATASAPCPAGPSSCSRSAAVVFVYLLPIINPPLITTTDSDFGARAVPRAPCTRWSRSGSTSWSGMPGCSTSATSASSPSAPSPSASWARRTAVLPLLLCIPIAMAVTLDLRHHPRRADPAGARRLPGDRDARLR